MQQAKNGRDEKQRGNRRENQSSDDRAAERRILFASFAQSHGHGNHADNHGQSGHQYRTEACKTGFNRRQHGIALRG